MNQSWTTPISNHLEHLNRHCAIHGDYAHSPNDIQIIQNTHFSEKKQTNDTINIESTWHDTIFPPFQRDLRALNCFVLRYSNCLQKLHLQSHAAIGKKHPINLIGNQQMLFTHVLISWIEFWLNENKMFPFIVGTFRGRDFNTPICPLDRFETERIDWILPTSQGGIAWVRFTI